MATLTIDAATAVATASPPGRVRQLVTTGLSLLLLLGVLAAGLALIGVPKLAGARPLTVLTGSMTPTYQPGDVVIVREVDAETLQIGDVVTFQSEPNDPRLTTHRIIAVQFGAEGREYVTQGDANGAVDPAPVRPEQVRGTVWYSVPFVGHVATKAASSDIRTALDAGAVCLLLYGASLFLRGLQERRRRTVVA